MADLVEFCTMKVKIFIVRLKEFMGKSPESRDVFSLCCFVGVSLNRFGPLSILT